MTIETLRSQRLILLECLSGSKAYHLSTPDSDTDIKGVFILPKKEFYAMQYIPQISDGSNNIVFYELGRFMQLLAQNNPNILELLNTPEDAIIYKHPVLNELNSVQILSKLCRNTFGDFALSQIKKAKGLNKKIMNPIDKERKTPLDFCYVAHKNGSMPLSEFLAIKNWEQRHCGLTNIPHMQDVYGLYHQPGVNYNGIIRHADSNDVALSSIPKAAKQEALLYYNKNGYSAYCRAYKEYWDWVAKRNEARYENTQSHGKNYDAKNMMHTFRLLQMAIEIAVHQQIWVSRSDRDFLLDIKSGKYDYETLLNMADEKKREMDTAFEYSSLPETPDKIAIDNLAYKIREQLYIGG